jgi:RNA polymerase sigma-70 factor (ECF subfamily)
LFAGACGPVQATLGRERSVPLAPNRSAARRESLPMGYRSPVLALRAPRQRRAPMTIDLAHLSDEALVALCVRADEAALAELYDRYGRVAYGLALRILRDEGLAEDAVQEGFLAVWRSAGRFVPERARASTWILTLVHRRAVDLVRRSERRRAEPLETMPDEGGGSTEELAWLQLERQRVQAALRRLPDQQREALELAYYGGFTQSELAERLGQPLGTIKSRMFTGLSRLRDLLAESEREETRWSPSGSTS